MAGAVVALDFEPRGGWSTDGPPRGGRHGTEAFTTADFRIRPDGSAIEPVVGSTRTMGFAFTESGDRFVISTGTPGIAG